MEEELPVPEIQGFLFPEREEPFDVPAGGLPVDLGDPLPQGRLHPARIDLDSLAGPRTLLVD